MKHYSDVYFLVDIDNTYAQAVKPREPWITTFDYEIDSETVNAKKFVLLKEDIDNKVEPFGKYEEANARITINIKISSKEKKRKKMIEDLEAKLCTQGKNTEPL